MRIVPSEHFPASMGNYALRHCLDLPEALKSVVTALENPCAGRQLSDALPNIRLAPLTTRNGPPEYVLYALDLRNDVIVLMEVNTYNLDVERSAFEVTDLVIKIQKCLGNIEKIILILG